MSAELKECGCKDSAIPLVTTPSSVIGLFSVTCYYCGVGVHGFEFESDAIKAWNLIREVEYVENECRFAREKS